MVRRLVAVPGQAACLEWLGIALISWGISLKRVDPIPLWRGMRLDAWAALCVASFSLAIYLLVGMGQRFGRSKESEFSQAQEIPKG